MSRQPGASRRHPRLRLVGAVAGVSMVAAALAIAGQPVGQARPAPSVGLAPSPAATSASAATSAPLVVSLEPPSGALPPAAVAARGTKSGTARLATFDCPRPGTVIFYSPHADDETLSMGELIAYYAACHWHVEAVLVTDGADSGARVGIDRILAHLRLAPLTVAEFAAARQREFVAALGALGVPAGHVHFAGWHGDQLTVADAATTIRSYAVRFPGALHVTMSRWDINPDHAALGRALALVAASMGLDARWTVFHRYWTTISAGAGCTIVDEPTSVRAVRAAAAAYGRWDPWAGWYSIGVNSVWRDFRVLQRDPRDLACTGPGPAMPRPAPARTPTPSPAAASPGPSPSPTPSSAIG